MAKIYIDGKLARSGLKTQEETDMAVLQYAKIFPDGNVVVRGAKERLAEIRGATVLAAFTPNLEGSVRTVYLGRYLCPKCGHEGLRQVTGVRDANGRWKIRCVSLKHWEVRETADGPIIRTVPYNYDNMNGFITNGRTCDFTEDPSGAGIVDFAGLVPITNPTPP